MIAEVAEVDIEVVAVTEADMAAEVAIEADTEEEEAELREALEALRREEDDQ